MLFSLLVLPPSVPSSMFMITSCASSEASGGYSLSKTAAKSHQWACYQPTGKASPDFFLCLLLYNLFFFLVFIRTKVIITEKWAFFSWGKKEKRNQRKKKIEMFSRKGRNVKGERGRKTRRTQFPPILPGKLNKIPFSITQLAVGSPEVIY